VGASVGEPAAATPIKAARTVARNILNIYLNKIYILK
jgi:hypothetical protein